MNMWNRLRALIFPAPLFKEGDKVMIRPESEAQANFGCEQPEGRVVAPGKHTLIILDPEFAEFEDERLMEVDERDLIKIDVRVEELRAGYLRRRQAE